MCIRLMGSDARSKRKTPNLIETNVQEVINYTNNMCLLLTLLQKL